MNRGSAISRCGALSGLALLFVLPCSADELLRDSIRDEMGDRSYVLVEDQRGARLFVFSSEDGERGMLWQVAPPGSMAGALAKTRSADARMRVRGLTELAGEPVDAALNAALVLLSDPYPAVREEAVNLIIDHPHGDIDNVVAIALGDPSPRVREAVQDFVGEDPDDADPED